MIQPEILYEDAQLIICYKPAGIATQTKKLGQKDMVSILLNHVAQECFIECYCFPLLSA